MSPVKLTIHNTGLGRCCLTGKADTEGLTVTFDDGTVREQFLSWKAFRQLLALKAPAAKPEPKPVAVQPNGPPVAVPAK